MNAPSLDHWDLVTGVNYLEIRNIDRLELCPLHLAEINLKCVNFLIQHDASCFTSDFFQRDPLHYAFVFVMEKWQLTSRRCHYNLNGSRRPKGRSMPLDLAIVGKYDKAIQLLQTAASSYVNGTYTSSTLPQLLMGLSRT